MFRTPHLTRRVATGVGATLALALALTACAPPGSDGSNDTPEDTDVSTSLGDDPIELVLYDGAGPGKVNDQLIAAFEEQYPNVTITTRYDPDDVQAQNAPRVLASADPPDIARVVALGDVVGNGLLTNLDPWADAYGWGDLPTGQLAMYRVDEDGVRGSGSQYTVASGFVMAGVYYNTTIADELGITAPTTVEEWEAAMQTAKDAGVTPLMAGNASGALVLTVQFMLNGALGAQTMNEWVFNTPDTTIDTPEAVEAVAIVSRWIDAGYINADANGTDGVGAEARFGQGEGLFHTSGNWAANALETAMGDDGVAFLPPPALNAGELMAQSDPLSNFGIPANSDNKNAAAFFLNWLTSDEARAIVVENGYAPSGNGDVPPTDPGSLKESVQLAFADLVEADGQVQFVQNATSGATASWNAQTQLLFGGRITPEEYLATIQAAYESELQQ